jgi:cysteine desulfurase / selenocysteine lyase
MGDQAGMTDVDVQRWRMDTPGCANVTHLNNAGASLPPAVVLQSTFGHLEREARHGGYEAAAAFAEAMDRVYTSIGALVGADGAQIALTENATRAWDMAFYSIPFRPGDRILTGVSEYASNYLAFLQMRAAKGVEIVVIPDDPCGDIDLQALDSEIDERTRLVAITHVPTNGGVTSPVQDIGAIAKRHGAFFLVDACQSAGQLPIDVNEIGCDFLSATGRKYLRGPRGTGFLYARAETTAGLHPPFIDLHAATWTATDAYELRPGARRFESWERNVAGYLGLGAAVDYALAAGVDRIEERVCALAARLRTALSELSGVTVRDKGRRLSGIVTFSHDRLSADQITGRLRERGINTWICRSPATRLDHERRALPDLVRASVHYFNTHNEIDLLARALRTMIGDRP